MKARDLGRLLRAAEQVEQLHRASLAAEEVRAQDLQEVQAALRRAHDALEVHGTVRASTLLALEGERRRLLEQCSRSRREAEACQEEAKRLQAELRRARATLLALGRLQEAAELQRGAARERALADLYARRCQEGWDAGCGP